VTKLLLSLHVLAAIIAIGPVTVAASMFPGLLRRHDPSDDSGAAVLRNLHRICRVYAGLGILVPLFGLATASTLGVLTDAWLITSMVLTAVAAAILIGTILPRQSAAIEALRTTATAPVEGVATMTTATATATATAARLGMVTGVFNLIWATVVVLMIVRPGSTTGA
jgi:sulfite exporter TauE/SafE